MLMGRLKSNIPGASQTISQVVRALIDKLLLAVMRAVTWAGWVPRAGGQSAGFTMVRGGIPPSSTHQKKLSHSPHRRASELAGEEIAVEAAHPVEQPQHLVVEMFVAAAQVLDDASCCSRA